MNPEQRKEIEEKLRKRGFAELSKKPGIWIRGVTPNMRLVDLNKTSQIKEFAGLPIVCISTSIERIEEGHGITEIDDIRAEIAGILKMPEKEQPAPNDDKKTAEAEKRLVKKLSERPEFKHEQEVLRREHREKDVKVEERKTDAPEVKGEVKKMESEKKEEKGIVQHKEAEPPAKLSDHKLDEKINREKAKRFVKGQGDFYKVRGEDRPDAAMIQKLANEMGISVEITKAEQTDRYAHVEVVGISGNLRVPAVVHHDFDTEFMLKTMEIIKNNPQILDHYEGAKPVIKEGVKIKVGDEIVDAQYYLVHALLSFKKFSLRDACTKAMSIVELKLMNQEFRDAEEIASEQNEREMIDKSNKKK